MAVQGFQIFWCSVQGFLGLGFGVHRSAFEVFLGLQGSELLGLESFFMWPLDPSSRLSEAFVSSGLELVSSLGLRAKRLQSHDCSW